MTFAAPPASATIATLPSLALAAILDQSSDCVKLIGLDGDIQYMNENGLCAMEIAEFSAVEGTLWTGLLPEVSRQAVIDSYTTATRDGRADFRMYAPTGRGVPRWWDVTVSRVIDSADRHVGFLSISRDDTANHNSREALEVATAELKHRLKNTYMMIIGLMTSCARGDPGREAFAAEMGERLRALSTAQSLFAADEAPCAIVALVPALVVPFGVPGCPVTIGALAEVLVDQGQANAIALLLGELAVNSAKHGALRHGGDIAVGATAGGNRLSIVWTERSEQRVERHARAGGQGLVLIERIVRARGGTTAIEWRDFGVRVEVVFELG